MSRINTKRLGSEETPSVIRTESGWLMPTLIVIVDESQLQGIAFQIRGYSFHTDLVSKLASKMRLGLYRSLLTRVSHKEEVHAWPYASNQALQRGERQGASSLEFLTSIHFKHLDQQRAAMRNRRIIQNYLS